MYLSSFKLRSPFMIVIMLMTLGNGILQAQNPHKPAVLWSVSVPAGRYFKEPDGIWAGPLTHTTIDRTIRLIEIDFDTAQLPSTIDGGGACMAGEIGLMVAPYRLELAPPRETSLQFSTLAPNQVPGQQPTDFPPYSGVTATLDLRGKNVVFQAGTKLWLYLAAQDPGCDLPSGGNVTIEYEIVR